MTHDEFHMPHDEFHMPHDEFLDLVVMTPRGDEVPVRELLHSFYSQGRVDMSDVMKRGKEWDPQSIADTPRPPGGWSYCAIPWPELRDRWNAELGSLNTGKSA